MDRGIHIGLTMGTTIAMIISYNLSHSFWWMFLHGIFGWFYVIYWGIFL